MAVPGVVNPLPHLYSRPAWIAYAVMLPPDTWSITAIALGDGDTVVTGDDDSDTVGVMDMEAVDVGVWLGVGDDVGDDVGVDVGDDVWLIDGVVDGVGVLLGVAV
jgi:hypothetical protein